MLARALPAALLALPLLFAAGAAGAHTSDDGHGHFRVELNGSTALTVTEGHTGTIAVRIRCVAHERSSCNYSGYADQNQNNRDEFTIAATTPSSGGGVTFGSADRKLGYSIVAGLNTIALNSTGTVTLSAGGNTVADGTRTVTVSGTTDESGGQNFFTRIRDLGAIVQSATLTILDDDQPQLSLAIADADDTIAEGETTTVTATVDTAPSSALTVTVTAAAGVTVANANTITIPANMTSGMGSVTITADDDNVDDDGKMVVITAAATGHASGLATLTVTDNDTAALALTELASATNPRETVTEAGGTAAFKIALATEPTNEVRVDVTSSDAGECRVSTAGSATPAAMKRLSFSTTTWSTPQEVTLTGQNDSADDGDRDCTITLDPWSPGVPPNNDAKYNVLASTTFTVRNTDDDATPTVTLASSAASISENGGTATITATLNRASGAATTITLSAPTGTTLNRTTLTIDAGDTSSSDAGTATERSATLTATNNTRDEPNRPVTVTGTASNSVPASGMLSVTGAAVTLTDDDAAPAVSLSLTPANGMVAENGGTAEVTATLTGTTSSAATTVTVTAVSGLYTVEADATIVIAAGMTTDAETVTITAVDNFLDDASDRSGAVTGTAQNNQGAGAVTGATLTLTDNDDAAVTVTGLAQNTAPHETVTEAGGTATFNVALATRPTANVTVTVSSSNAGECRVSVGSAAPGASTTLTFTAANWSAAQTVTLTGRDDAVDDGDQDCTITAAAASTGDTVYNSDTEVPDRMFTARNTDDDDAALVLSELAASMNPRETVTEGGGTAAFKVALASEPTADVTVTVTSSDAGECRVSTAGSATPAASKTLTFTAATAATLWSTPQEVTLTGQNDDADDGDVDCTITVAAASTGDAVYNSNSDVPDRTFMARNTDDDTVGLVLSKTSVMTSENTADQTVNRDTFTVKLGSQPTADVTVALSSSDTGEATVSPASLTFSATNWNTAQTVTVTGVDDALTDTPQNYTITLNPASTGDTAYNALVNRTVSGTNADDEAPTASLTLSSSAIAENGGTATVSASLDSASTAATTVTIAAVSGLYTVVGRSTITIAASATTSADRVTIRAVDDRIENNPARTGQVTASVSNPSALGVSSNTATAALTLTDDDMAGLALTGLQAADPKATLAENGTAVFRVALASAPTADVTVTATSGAPGVCLVSTGGAAGSASTTLTFTSGNWSAAQAVTLTGVHDNLADGGRDCAVTLATASAGAGGDAVYHSNTEVPDQSFTARVTEVDAVGLAVSKTSVATSEDGTSDSFTVALRTIPSDDVTVALAVTGAADEVMLSASSLTFTATTWSAPQTVTATGQDDDDLDRAQNYQIGLSTTSNDGDYSGLTATVSGTNQDNEAPTVTLELSSAAVAEGGSVTVTASLDRAVEVATAITVSAAAGPGAAGSFRLSSNRTLTVPANSRASEGEVTILAVDDAVDAPDKTVRVRGEVGANDLGTLDPAPVTLTIEDDEAAPTVALAPASPEIWESGAGSRTEVSATLSHPSSAETRVTVRSLPGVYRVVGVAPASRAGGAGRSAAPGTRQTDGEAVIVIPALRTTSDDRVLIEAVDAAGAGADQEVEIRASAVNSQGVATASPTAALTVLDDETASAALVLEPARVSEGGTARVSAELRRAVGAAVTVTISAAPGENAAAEDFSLGSERVLTIPAGQTASAGSASIATRDDGTDAPDRAVRVSATAESSVAARTPQPVLLAIADDDETPQVALVLTPAVIGQREPNNVSTVTATLERPSSEATTITVSAVGEDFRLSANKTLTVAAGATASAGTVTLTAANAGEDAPDREVTVSGRAANAHAIVQPADAALTIRSGFGAEVTEVLLPEAARAMADSWAGAVRRRLERAAAAVASELPALTELLAKHGAAARDGALDWKKALAGSSFALPLNAGGGEAGGGAGEAGGEAGGGGVTAWGSGDYRDLDGEARGVKWDGEVASAHLGLDRRLANGLRVGVAASWSAAKFDYEHHGLPGEWELEMGGAQPYLGWTTPGGVELWASAGAGSGELQVTDGGARDTSEADMRMAAAGARGPLYATESGLQVSLRGEALYSSFEVDGNDGRIQAHTADVSRLRLALEARRERVLASGARLSPRFELGLRHDGGDGETGAGVELGGGAEYVSGRLTASGGARALVANSNYDEWGADLALAYAPGADGRGFSFRLAPSWGAAQSGTRELWERGAPGLNGAAEEPDPGARLEAELGYGLKSPWSRGLLTLTLSAEAGEDGGRGLPPERRGGAGRDGQSGAGAGGARPAVGRRRAQPDGDRRTALLG